MNTTYYTPNENDLRGIENQVYFDSEDLADLDTIDSELEYFTINRLLK